MEVEFTGKCIACGKRFEITPSLMKEAEDIGCAISPCCNFPSTVEKVEIKRTASNRGEKR